MTLSRFQGSHDCHRPYCIKEEKPNSYALLYPTYCCCRKKRKGERKSVNNCSSREKERRKEGEKVIIIKIESANAA